MTDTTALTSDAPRKYDAPQSNTTPTISVQNTNETSVIDVASGMSVMAMALSALVAQSQLDVQATRDAIENSISSNVSSSNPTRVMTEDDVTQNQQRLAMLASSNLSTLSSGDLNNRLGAGLSNLIGNSRHTFTPILTPGVIDVENRVTPDIDQIEVDIHRNKGISDAFINHVTFSVQAAAVDSGYIRSLRLFRADVSSPSFARALNSLSLRGMSILSSPPMSNRSKNDDTISMLERRFNIDGIANELTELNPFDRFSNQRVVALSAAFQDASVDTAVANDPRFIEARRLQDPMYDVYAPDSAVVVGRSGITDAQLGTAHASNVTAGLSDFQFTVNKNNAANFKQIFAGTPSDLTARFIGDRYYYTFDDTSVLFGHRYLYFAVSVNRNMVQSNRSPLVAADIDGLRVPPRPRQVVVTTNSAYTTLAVFVEDQLVERFEIWKRETVRSEQTTSPEALAVIDTGFSLVQEIDVSQHEGGATWTDMKTIPGRSYVYRVYSVDVFGNKSESPNEVEVHVPQRTDGDVDHTLTIPSVLAEVDSKTQKIKITIYCRDPDVKRIRLERRDLTVNQQNFVVPTESSRTILGQFSAKHSSFIYGERVADTDVNTVWTGYFDNPPEGKIEFLDRLVSFDRIYQYRVHGLSEVGRRTSYDHSRPVLVYRRPMINAPVNFSSSFATGSNGVITGVRLSWNSASLDVSAEDKFGSQIALADRSIRTLYQIERQDNGGRWQRFNLIDSTEYFDPVETSGSVAPGYRPAYLRLNNLYEYRLQAVMSGGYISNKTDQIAVYVANNVRPPQNFNLKAPDSHVRPLYIMLNWDTDPLSGPVDHWVIERSEVNNYAASRINAKNTEDFKRLPFKEFRTVYREASRFRSFRADVSASSITSAVINGESHFLDAQVSMGNTYFYKLTAVDGKGNSSKPVYRGMKLTNASNERLMTAIVSKSERDVLTQNFVAARVTTNIASPAPKDSMGLNPSFSSPSVGVEIIRSS